MGTRADFYVGRGKNAQWLGSVAYDGDPSGIADDIFEAATEEDFRKRVRRFLKKRSDGTLPEMGWPWPWITSHLTNEIYAFFDNKVYRALYDYEASKDPSHPRVNVSRQGIEKNFVTAKTFWCDPLDKDEIPLIKEPNGIAFPNMESVQNVAIDKRSGIILFGVLK